MQEFKFHDIALSDRTGMDEIRNRYGEESSSYTFPVVYCWQKEMKLSLYLSKSCFLIKYGRAGTMDFFYPCADKEKGKQLIQELLKQYGEIRLHFISQENKEYLFQEFSEQVIELEEMLGDSDYIGRIDDFVRMQGKQYKDIRKYIHRVEHEGDITYSEIMPEDIEELKKISGRWLTNCSHGLYSDHKPEEIAFEHYVELGLSGFIFRKNGEGVGYVIGSSLNDVVYDIHFMKKMQSISGLDFYMVHILCCILQDRFQYFNMEDDMENEGIRLRKKLFRPAFMNKAYRAVIREKIKG